MPAKLFLSVGAAVFTASLFAAVKVASAATPAELQKVRHEHYEELGDAFKAVRDASKAAAPDFAALEKAAEIVSKASVDQQQWFPKGTGPEVGKTRALPEIWSKPDDFEYDPKKPLPKLGKISMDGFWVAVGDGSVRFVNHKIKETTLRAAITRNGGEVFNWDD